MLKTRVATALVLLAILLPVLYSASFIAFAVLALVFFAAAIWECQRLFAKPAPLVMAAIWTGMLGYFYFHLESFSQLLLFAFASAFWIFRLLPTLARGLPDVRGFTSGLLSALYGISIFACFVAIAVFFKYSPMYLFSVMAIVWVADIGAYFSGKALGKHKLAPTISPGKSWEGAIGGWVCVVALATATAFIPGLENTFTAHLLARKGWLIFVLAMSVLTAASVVGDLFESSLKRRVGMKDSSKLLPGHGGVLDRIDALIPVLPLAALLDLWR
ncbi:phosphatidate cytidylyltransferase [Undibacterium sp. Ji50W]|uniref:phosphatidate cytidylyltransferase n=1 Tax=Undibacterium sp. Ji50W TaxID=3413041 RepID=UPI003BF06BF1